MVTKVQSMQPEPVNKIFESEADGLSATVSLWGSQDLPGREECPNEIIIIIPGNPGLVNFYYDYARFLHTTTGFPVWTIGHAGHNGGNNLQNKRNADNLHKQLNNKIEFIEKYTQMYSKVHLIGHSVGGWMCTEMLERNQLEQRIASVSLLFPTLEFIADTPNGYWVNGCLRNITSLLLLAVYIFTLIPKFISKFLVYIYFLILGYPYEYIPYVYLYLQVSVMKRCLGLAYHEMDTIKDLNLNALANNTHRVKVVFNDKDGWAPGSVFKKLRQLIPNLHIEQSQARHAFVMGQSKQVADVTTGFILN